MLGFAALIHQQIYASLIAGVVKVSASSAWSVLMKLLMLLMPFSSLDKESLFFSVSVWMPLIAASWLSTWDWVAAKLLASGLCT